MSRVHDMGGRYGDGPVDPIPEGEEPQFVKDWHRPAMALTLASGGLGAWNIDESRHTRESLPPKTYAAYSYYEKWIAAVADLLVAKGLVTAEEIAGGASADAPLSPRALKGAAVAAVLAKGSPASRPGPAPRFAPGDRVQSRLPARNLMVDGGHTRLPAYAAGFEGRIALCHGAHVLPDSNAHRLGEAPEPLYTVAFPAAAIWGQAEGAGDEVMVDLWESYLEPVA